MPAVGIQHLDLAVADVDRSLGFYDLVLGPLGLQEYARFQTYRGTEEVVYLQFGHSWIGIRPADGGTFGHYDVGLEHLAFQVDSREEVDDAHQRCRAAGAPIQTPPEVHYAYAGEDYYSFFAFDPDGIRIEVVCDRNHGRGWQ
jgi:catechol 2,3-dioxygenase-like lactoylglutathione lyase family enzyme